MTSANEFRLTVVAAGAATWAGLWARTEGAPVLGPVIGVAGALLFLVASYRLKQVKAHGPDTHGAMAPDPALRARVRYFWFVAAGLLLGSLLIIPLLPYMVDGYAPELLYWVVPAQIAVVALFLFWMRRRVFGVRSRAEKGGT